MCLGKIRVLPTLRYIDQPIADGINHQFRGLVDAESVHDVGTVHRHGIGAQAELSSYFLVRQTANNQLEDLELPNR